MKHWQSQDAIARQRVDTQRSATEQAKAAVEAQQADIEDCSR